MSKKCFIVCAIGDINSPIRHDSDSVFKCLIEPVCNKLDIEPIRADLLYQPTKITDDIFNHLDNDDFVIADISILNANVFIEIGYRLKTKKPLILIRNANSNIQPFDISAHRIMSYSTDALDIDDSKKSLELFLCNSRERKIVSRLCTLNGKPIQNTYDDGTIEIPED